jgi:hypothetical protein
LGVDHVGGAVVADPVKSLFEQDREEFKVACDTLSVAIAGLDPADQASAETVARLWRLEAWLEELRTHARLPLAAAVERVARIRRAA